MPSSMKTRSSETVHPFLYGVGLGVLNLAGDRFLFVTHAVLLSAFPRIDGGDHGESPFIHVVFDVSGG